MEAVTADLDIDIGNEPPLTSWQKEQRERAERIALNTNLHALGHEVYKLQSGLLAGRSITEISRAADLSVSYVSRTFRGLTHPRAKVFLALVKALDTTPETLMAHLEAAQAHAREQERRDLERVAWEPR